MERVLEYTIGSDEANQKISSFLKGKHFSQQNLVDLKKDAESIKVNGLYARQNHLLETGDFLRVAIRENQGSDQILPVELDFEIFYEDEDLLVINKPAGMPVHPSRNNPDNSLGNGLAYYFKEQGIPFTYRCVNRLDRDTSGLTIVAKHGVSGAILSQMVARKEVRREYRAIVEGCPQPEVGLVDAPIARAEEGQTGRVVDWIRGDRAVTHYQVLQKGKLPDGQAISYVALVLETGRTHQIRVHMKHIGCPLLGDYLYNPTDQHMNRQALHAYSLDFVHPMTGEMMHFEAPMPVDMKNCFTFFKELW